MGMSVLYSRCAGLDVHKETVVACLMLTASSGKMTREVRTFASTTLGLQTMAQWFASHEVSHLAMESTGIYWRPVFNILEGRFEVILVNAQHMKAVPGHKTDVKDSEWLADLLRHGLLKASFIPPKPIRDLREPFAPSQNPGASARPSHQSRAKGAGDRQHQALQRRL